MTEPVFPERPRSPGYLVFRTRRVRVRVIESHEVPLDLPEVLEEEVEDVGWV